MHYVDQPVAHQLDDAVLILFGCANTDQVDLALIAQLTQNQQRLRVVVPSSRPGVQLEQVDSLAAKISQSLVDVVSQVGRRISILPSTVGAWWPRSGIGRSLCGDHDPFAAILDHFANQPLAAALYVVAAMIIVDGAQAVLATSLRSAGDVLVPLAIFGVTFWGFGVPLAYVLGLTAELGVPALLGAMTIALGLAALILGVRFHVISKRGVRPI